jgi:orotate phosphoribosyltransferase
MKVSEETALKIAEYLLQIKAIKLNIKKPFVWASGWKSPIYCDNRITLSYPVIRNFIRQEFVNVINNDFGDIDLIAGVATGGIAHGVLVAQDLGLPFAYVRSAAKDHGLANRIEGVVESGQSVVVIEDLVSTGGSSLNAVEALRKAGANVKGLISIFNYGFEIAEKRFEKANCPMYALSNYEFLIRQALEENYIREEDVLILKHWRKDPQHWNGK